MLTKWRPTRVVERSATANIIIIVPPARRNPLTLVYGETLSLAKYFAPLIVIAALAVVLNRAVNWAEHVFVPWKQRAFA